MFKEGPKERSVIGTMDRNRLMTIYSIIKKKKKKKTQSNFHFISGAVQSGHFREAKTRP